MQRISSTYGAPVVMIQKLTVVVAAVQKAEGTPLQTKRRVMQGVYDGITARSNLIDVKGNCLIMWSVSSDQNASSKKIEPQ